MLRSTAFLATIVAMALSDSYLAAEDKTPRTLGKIERLDPRLDQLIAPDAQIEVLADGFDWSEGPAWNRPEGFLVFSDVPRNTVYQWKPGQGISVFLKPSGYTGPKTDYSREPGSNGLAYDAQNRLILCQHGDRRLARLEKDKTFTTLADRYQGKRFNSPNDLAIKSDGAIYFTDPYYGLPKGAADPTRELDFCGVFRLAPDGEVTLLTKEFTRPNGIAFSPDEKTLYVAQSDPAAALWRAFDVQPDGTLANSRVFFDATDRVGKHKGMPDGLKVDKAGNLFATGPGGVLVFAPDGTHLGTIQTGQATANCALGDDGRALYITADMLLLRVPLLARNPTR